MSQKSEFGISWHSKSPELNIKTPPTSPKNDIVPLSSRQRFLDQSRQMQQNRPLLERAVHDLEDTLRLRQQKRLSHQPIAKSGLSLSDDESINPSHEKILYELLRLDQPSDRYSSTSTSASSSLPGSRYPSPPTNNLKYDHRQFPAISALLKSPQKSTKPAPSLARNRSSSNAAPPQMSLFGPKPHPKTKVAAEVPEVQMWRAKREEAWMKEQENKKLEVEAAKERRRQEKLREKLSRSQNVPHTHLTRKQISVMDTPQMQDAFDFILERDRPSSVPPKARGHSEQLRSALNRNETHDSLRELENRMELLKVNRDREMAKALRRKRTIIPQTPNTRRVHFDLTSSTPELSSASVSESEESSTLSEDYSELDPLSQAYDVFGATHPLGEQFNDSQYFDDEEFLAQYIAKTKKDELARLLAQDGADDMSHATPRASYRNPPPSAQPTPQQRNMLTPRISTLRGPAMMTPRMPELTPRPSKALQTPNPNLDPQQPSLTTDFGQIQEIYMRQAKSSTTVKPNSNPTVVRSVRTRSNSTPYPVDHTAKGSEGDRKRAQDDLWMDQMLQQERQDIRALQLEKQMQELDKKERVAKERTANLLARMRGLDQVKKIAPTSSAYANFKKTNNPW